MYNALFSSCCCKVNNDFKPIEVKKKKQWFKLKHISMGG